jgi:putative ABC transport system permease protein
VIVALLSTLYPAWVVSSFQPAKVLRGKLIAFGNQGFPLRKTLVVGQFVIAQVLVVCTILALKQMQFFQQKSMGFDKEGIVTVSLPERSEQTRERLRRELLRHPEIKDVTFGLVSPSSTGNWWWDPVLYPTLPNGEATFRLQFADVNYFSFYKIPLVAGRAFLPSDTSAFVAIINEKAARDMGFTDPAKVVGENVGFWGGKRQIIGVVKDYHSESFKSGIVPHIFVNRDWNFQQAGIRIDLKQSPSALKVLEKEWKAVFPAYYFEYSFLDDELGRFYENERRFSNLIMLFAGLAILIGCLGLYGLVSFVCVQRTKEIGIRKVLGASVCHIMYLFSKEFTGLVSLAFLVATPAAYYLATKLLENFTYRITIGVGMFLAGIIASLTIALLTVGFQAIKAALANPVKSLRTE